MKKKKILLIFCLNFFVLYCSGNEILSEKLKERFGEKIEIEYLSDLSPYDIKSARFIEERTLGRFDFLINGEEKIQIDANIYVSAYFPKNKILPKQILTEELFDIKKVNIVREKGKESRSIILSVEESLMGMQSKHTLLPGEFLTVHSIQKTPAVKTGDRAQMRIWVGGVLLNTPVIIQQEAYVGDSVRVEVQSTKRILQGKLIDSQTVEVKI